VRIVNPETLETHVKIDMAHDETVTALAITNFYQLKDKRPCLLVATAEGQELIPKRRARKSIIKTYLYDEQFVPQLVHVTPVSEGEGVPLAMCAFEGRVLVSLSAADGTAALRLYELGKKRLLKKSEYRNSSCGGFVNLQVVGDRIFAADAFNGVHVIRLSKVDGQMYVVCDDTLPRYMSAMLMLDYNTVLGADKFDNIFVSRIPVEVREDQAGTGEAMVGSGGLRLGPDTTYILGKNHKFEPVNHFHVGETVTSLQKISLAPGAAEVVIYSTLSGGIGVLYPFASKKEYNLVLALETHMSNAMGTSLTGRDHAAFRGYYLPAKAVVDGDLIASFTKLPAKADVAELTGKSVNEIEKLIEEIRNRIT
jgi:splicing factor 3B subunit 3